MFQEETNFPYGSDFFQSNKSVWRISIQRTRKIINNILLVFILFFIVVMISFSTTPLYEFIMTNCDTNANCLNSVTANPLKFKYGDCFVSDSDGNQDQFGCKRILSGYMLTPEHSIESEPFSFSYTYNSWTYMARAFLHFTSLKVGSIPLKFTTMLGNSNQGTFSFGIRYYSTSYYFCVHLDNGISIGYLMCNPISKSTWIEASISYIMNTNTFYFNFQAFSEYIVYSNSMIITNLNKQPQPDSPDNKFWFITNVVDSFPFTVNYVAFYDSQETFASNGNKIQPPLKFIPLEEYCHPSCASIGYCDVPQDATRCGTTVGCDVACDLCNVGNNFCFHECITPLYSVMKSIDLTAQRFGCLCNNNPTNDQSQNNCVLTSGCDDRCNGICSQTSSYTSCINGCSSKVINIEASKNVDGTYSCLCTPNTISDLVYPLICSYNTNCGSYCNGKCLLQNDNKQCYLECNPTTANATSLIQLNGSLSCDSNKPQPDPNSNNSSDPGNSSNPTNNSTGNSSTPTNNSNIGNSSESPKSNSSNLRNTNETSNMGLIAGISAGVGGGGLIFAGFFIIYKCCNCCNLVPNPVVPFVPMKSPDPPDLSARKLKKTEGQLLDKKAPDQKISNSQQTNIKNSPPKEKKTVNP